jgi:Primosomal protein N'' (replication factor Y) - superfamily II helicase
MPHPCVLRVAINTPLRRLFDYLPPPDIDIRKLVPGMRLLVPFGKGKPRVGMLAEFADCSNVETPKLKHVLRVLDQGSLFEPGHLEFLLWAAEYYHHPAGEVILNSLPKPLKNGEPAKKRKYIIGS